LEDVRRLPFTTRRELEEDQFEHPPFGGYVCSHPSTWYRVFSTSGTTGRPLKRVVSYRDWELCVRWCLRRWVEISGKQVVAYLHPVEGAFGPSAATEAWLRRGAMVVHLGRYRSEQKVRLIHELKPTSVFGTTSYLLYLGRLAEEMGMPFTRLGSLRILSFGGEAGGSAETNRQRLRERWGEVTFLEGYGLTELFTLGTNCPYSPALHISGDVVLTEVVDPRTGEPVPEGEPGELVYTMLVGDTQPLLRYRSGDIGRLDPEPRCACGSSWPRIARGIEGRADETIWYRGVNVYPAAIEQVVRAFRELSDNYRIVLRGTFERPELVVQVEPATDEPPEGLRERLEARLREALGVRAAVEILRPGTLPPAEYKVRRVSDERREEVEP
jgi:phenylacetate-CoA ligase